MKRYEVSRIRNVGIVAQVGAGKTSLTEAILYASGAVNRLGKVEEGTTATDFDEDEIRRKTTISSALAFSEWKGGKINLLDTPGASIFLTDAKICLRVVDGAVIVVHAGSGIKVQTEKVWGFADAYRLPRLLFVSHLDRERADFTRSLEDIRKNLCPTAIPVQAPIGSEASFRGVVDLVRGRAYVFHDDVSGRFTEAEIPEELQAGVEESRAALLEAVAEADDELLERYLEAGTLSEEELRLGLRRGILHGKLVPVLCGSATKVIGIQPLLDFILEYFPSPAERDAAQGIDPRTGERVARAPKEDEHLSALVFKTIADPYAGKISLFRVCSGILTPDSFVLNTAKGAKERIGQLVTLRGKQQIPVEAISAGDLGAVAKLKETVTGDTLSDEKHPVRFDPIQVPNPVIEYAIEPKAKGDEEKISLALSRLQEEDPTLKVRRDPQTKEIIIAGMGKPHLEVIVDRLKRKFGVEVTMKTPRIPYKETIHGEMAVQGRYKKQTGGRGQYGDCWIKLEPLPRGGGYEFVNAIAGGVIPRQYIPAVEKGILKAMEEGVLAGYPVVDTKITLYDGSHHPVDSSDLAFQIAGSLAFKKGFMQANPGLLEPLMHVEVIAPDECMGDIIGDLNSRRGRVLGIEAKGKSQVVKGMVPLAEMLEYAPQLRSLTADRGDYTMEFSHYEEVPAHIQEKIIAEAKREKEGREE